MSNFLRDEVSKSDSISSLEEIDAQGGDAASSKPVLLRTPSLIEKYDQYLRNCIEPEPGELDDTVIREEYAQIRDSTASTPSVQSRLSSSLPGVNQQTHVIKEPNVIVEIVEKLSQEPRSGLFCSQDELDALQDKYAQVLNYIYNVLERSGEETEQDLANELDKKLKTKIGDVQKARDKFYEIQQQVREYIYQLELAERCKMESVS